MDEKAAGELAPGRLLGRGRDTDVYDLGDGRVLRRYRMHYDHRRRFLRAFRKAAHTDPAPYVAATCRDRLDNPK